MTQSRYEINPAELSELMARAERLRSVEGARVLAGFGRTVRGWITRQNAVIDGNRSAGPDIPSRQLSGW